MTKQQQIEILQSRVESLQAALKVKSILLEETKQKLESLPEEIDYKKYQKFKSTELAKYVEKYVDELISENLKINSPDEDSYSGYYHLDLTYKDYIVSSCDGQININRNLLEA